MTATARIACAPQYRRALERANEVRLARAELKRQVRRGERGAADVILTVPWEVQSMTVSDLLMSQRRWGLARCRKVLIQIPLSENKTIGSMTERQRRALAATLARHQSRVSSSNPVTSPSQGQFTPALAAAA